jgi:hypothetical protein
VGSPVPIPIGLGKAVALESDGFFRGGPLQRSRTILTARIRRLARAMSPELVQLEYAVADSGRHGAGSRDVGVEDVANPTLQAGSVGIKAGSDALETAPLTYVVRRL